MDMALEIALVGAVVGLVIGYRRAIRKARYQAACEAVESVSAQLADAGLSNGWCVAQSKDGTIVVLPYSSTKHEPDEEPTPVRQIKPRSN